MKPCLGHESKAREFQSLRVQLPVGVRGVVDHEALPEPILTLSAVQQRSVAEIHPESRCETAHRQQFYKALAPKPFSRITWAPQLFLAFVLT